MLSKCCPKFLDLYASINGSKHLFCYSRAKSPTELSQINSLSDFPIPTTLENLMKKKRWQTLQSSTQKRDTQFCFFCKISWIVITNCIWSQIWALHCYEQPFLITELTYLYWSHRKCLTLLTNNCFKPVFPNLEKCKGHCYRHIYWFIEKHMFNKARYVRKNVRNHCFKHWTS